MKKKKEASNWSTQQTSWDSTERQFNNYNRYILQLSQHQGLIFPVVADPVFVDSNSTESVAFVARQIGLGKGILNYGGQDRPWTFLCCDGRPHTRPSAAHK